MIRLLKGGRAYISGRFEKTDIICVGNQIGVIGNFDDKSLASLPFEVELIDCTNLLIAPGLIDPHMHLSGGSGEGGGFATQSPAVLVEECISGGVTTVVGTLGVDTTTKTMPDLLAKAKAFNEIGLTARCYVGGYDLPPKTITGSVRDDMIYIPEIIGVGEVAIADRRAPEPDLKDLARASVDAFVGGMLTGKAGVTHFHTGPAPRGLKSVRDLLENHSIMPRKLHITHLERSSTLIKEGAELAKQGCFMDFDLYEPELHKWYRIFLDAGGPKNRLTVSSDAGVPSPKDIWTEICRCVQQESLTFEGLLPHFTEITADVLNFKTKGKIAVGMDADLFCFKESDYEIQHVIAGGKTFIKSGQLCFKKDVELNRRGYDIYEIHKN